MLPTCLLRAVPEPGAVLVGSGCPNKIPSARGLNNRHSFCEDSSGGWGSKVRVPVGLVPGESPPPGLGGPASLCPPGAQRARRSPALRKDPLVRYVGLASHLHLNLVTSKGPIFKGHHVGVRASTHRLWGGTFSPRRHYTCLVASPLPPPAFPARPGRRGLWLPQEWTDLSLLHQKLPRRMRRGQGREDGERPGRGRDELRQLHGGEARAAPQHDHERAQSHRAGG